MRDLKFRAWDTQAKCMLGGGGLQMNATTGGLDHLPSVIPLQYTGLLDKNGIEIYEGDIVRSFYTGNHPAVIECDAPDGGYNIREQDSTYVEIDSNTTMEVIGNVYENPELLIKGGK